MHRHNGIRKSIETEQWNYIPGKFNIPDICARVSPFIDLYPQSTWVVGLRVLYEQNLRDHSLEQEVEVVNALEKTDKQTNLLATSLSFQLRIKFEHYFSFYKLLRHITGILKHKNDISFKNLIHRKSN